MDESETGARWASVARETFEHSMVPWAGRSYTPWMRACSRPHPRDARGLVQIPDELYRVFQQRTPGQRLSRQAAERLGFPKLPGERAQARVRNELALGT